MNTSTATALPEDRIALRLQQMLFNLKKQETEAPLNAEDDFMQLLHLDSFDAVQLTVEMHERFGVEFGADPGDVDALRKFGGLVELVRKRAVKGLD